MNVDVVQYEEGLIGSRFAADVLEVRGKGKKREARVQYHALFDDAAEGGANSGDVLLREWVRASALAPPPALPPVNWHCNLKQGDEVEAFHEGGWWKVVVQSRVQTNKRSKDPPQFVVEAIGYGVHRTVDVHHLRPRAP
jgi:hypothetical protein